MAPDCKHGTRAWLYCDACAEEAQAHFKIPEYRTGCGCRDGVHDQHCPHRFDAFRCGTCGANGIGHLPGCPIPIPKVEEAPVTRTFETGATRNTDQGKYEYAGFLHPHVLEAFAAYMNVNRELEDGSRRASDNWQLGIPLSVYEQSEWRHHMEFWKIARGLPSDEGELAAIMGTVFNLFGYALERMKADPKWLERELAVYRAYRQSELDARKKNK